MLEKPIRTAAMSRAWALVCRWRVPLVLSAVLLALQAAGMQRALEYRRAAVLRGQVWRLLTGSLVHLGWMHLSRDIVGLFLIWALLAHSLDDYSWLWVLLASSLAVGLGLLILNPGIAWYVGISGALFGLCCAGALRQFREHPLFAAVLLLGMAVIIAWTWREGALPGETMWLGGNVIPQAHLYGALGGAGAMLALGALARRSRIRSAPRVTRPKPQRQG